MSTSEISENVMSPAAARTGWMALSIILGAVLWVGGVVGIAGGYLGSEEREVIRYCDGRCICDGGTVDARLMQRVCPDGWQKVFARSVRKSRKKRQRIMRERARRLRESPPEPPPSSLVPSV